MTIAPYASDAKISEALTAIGAELIGVTEQQLLQQILVAAATASGGGSGGSVTSVNGQTGTVVLGKSDVGLSQVDNTSDANKPVSTATQTALNSKLNLTGGTLTGALTINAASGPFLDIKQSSVDVFKVSSAVSGTCLDSLSGAGGQALMGAGGIYVGRRDSSNPATAAGYEAWIGNFNGSGINIRGTGFYGFGADNGNNLHSIRNAAFYYGGAAATIQMGANHATTPTAQVFKAHNVTTGTGADISIRGGTGSVADGYVRLGTASGGLAFFGSSGRTKPTGDTNTSVSTSGVGDPALVDTEFNGGSGNSYTIGGIVKVLKELGILG